MLTSVHGLTRELHIIMGNRFRIHCLAVITVLCAAARNLPAQLPAIDALTSKITDIGVFSQYRPPWSESALAIPGHYWNGFGVELSFTVFSGPKHSTSALSPARTQPHLTEVDSTITSSG